MFTGSESEKTITLELTGNGAMQTYTSNNQPWYGVRSKITSVVIGETVTTIGSYSFEGSSIHEITTIT